MYTEMIFYYLAFVTLLGALGSIFFLHPVYAILSLAFALVHLAGIFLLLSAPFVAVIQVILYAGAIVVLFLMTVMLLSLQKLQRPAINLKLGMSVFIAVGFAIVMIGSILASPLKIPVSSTALPSDLEHLSQIAHQIFGQYAFVFELMSVLILIAIMAIKLLADMRKKI